MRVTVALARAGGRSDHVRQFPEQFGHNAAAEAKAEPLFFFVGNKRPEKRFRTSIEEHKRAALVSPGARSGEISRQLVIPVLPRALRRGGSTGGITEQHEVGVALAVAVPVAAGHEDGAVVGSAGLFDHLAHGGAHVTHRRRPVVHGVRREFVAEHFAREAVVLEELVPRAGVVVGPLFKGRVISGPFFVAVFQITTATPRVLGHADDDRQPLSRGRRRGRALLGGGSRDRLRVRKDTVGGEGERTDELQVERVPEPVVHVGCGCGWGGTIVVGPFDGDGRLAIVVVVRVGSDEEVEDGFRYALREVRNRRLRAEGVGHARSFLTDGGGGGARWGGTVTVAPVDDGGRRRTPTVAVQAHAQTDHPEGAGVGRSTPAADVIRRAEPPNVPLSGPVKGGGQQALLGPVGFDRGCRRIACARCVRGERWQRDGGPRELVAFGTVGT